MRTVAVLFARADSIYKTMPGCDVWDEARDALRWPGGAPVVAHPPCKRWSVLNAITVDRYPGRPEFAWGNDGGTFRFALDAVRQWGGVLEHPAKSLAFDHFHLPRIGRGPDRFGGWSFEVRQVDWGHRAEKRTWLYAVGIDPDDLPPMPPRACAAPSNVEVMGKAEREHSPPEFAAWLVELARRTNVEARAAA